MKSQSTGRFGLLCGIAALLSGAPALAVTAGAAYARPALEVQDAKPAPAPQKDAAPEKQEKQEKQDVAKQKEEAAEARKQAEIAKKKDLVEQQKQQGDVARGGDDGHDHESEMVKARYGGEVEPNAKLDVEYGSEVHNFGQVTQGQLLEHTFLMKAGGTSDLVIRQAKPTCGCTVSQVLVESGPEKFDVYTMGDPITPGKQVKITAAMDTKNKSNKAEVRINVYTNDPVGLYQLGLAAQVEPFMTAQPSYLNLGDLAEDTVREEKIVVRTSRGQRIKLSFDESTPRPEPPGVTFVLNAVSPDEQGRSNHWEVTAKIGPGLQEGPMGYAMRLISDVEMAGAQPHGEGQDAHAADDGHSADDGHGHAPKGDPSKPQYYEISANVGGRVLGAISVSPQYLSMGLVRPGQPVSRSVRLVSNDPSIELSSIKARIQGAAGGEFPWIEHFTPIVRPIEGQTQAIEIELRLDGLPEGSEGSFKGEMVVETGNETKPEMKVTFSGVCRAGVGRSTKSGGN